MNDEHANDEHAPAIVDVNAFAGQFEQLVIDALSQVFPAGATYSSEDVIHAAAASAQQAAMGAVQGMTQSLVGGRGRGRGLGRGRGRGRGLGRAWRSPGGTTRVDGQTFRRLREQAAAQQERRRRIEEWVDGRQRADPNAFGSPAPLGRATDRGMSPRVRLAFQ